MRNVVGAIRRAREIDRKQSDLIRDAGVVIRAWNKGPREGGSVHRTRLLAVAVLVDSSSEEGRVDDIMR